MKALLIVSEMTFVPDNYLSFTTAMADHPDIVGIVIIKNRSWNYFFKGLLLSLCGFRLGILLLKNFLFPQTSQKVSAYLRAGKKVKILYDLNSPNFLDYLEEQKIDLLVNARTRIYYKSELLNKPRLGCINIHHGLLPHQRGLMCDFWSHGHNRPYGFSIHKMSEHLDDGEILKVVEVAQQGWDYPNALLQSARQEAETLRSLLHDIAHQESLLGSQNQKTSQTIYYPNPTLRDFFKMKKLGVKL